MKKLLIFICLLFSIAIAEGQDPKPTGRVSLQAPNNVTFDYNPQDSSIGMWKGSYKWNKFWSSKKVKYKVDSLARRAGIIYKLKSDTVTLKGYYTNYKAQGKVNYSDLSPFSTHVSNDNDLSSTNEIQDLSGLKLKNDSTGNEGFTSRKRLASELAKKEPANANIQAHISSDGDLSNTNEAQSFSNTTGSNPTVSVSSAGGSGGGSIIIEGAGATTVAGGIGKVTITTPVPVESDPNVSSWAKQPSKPSYHTDEISQSGRTNQFVTATEKTTWNGKEDNLGAPIPPTGYKYILATNGSGRVWELMQYPFTSGTTDHAALSNLSYAASGHTGFAALAGSTSQQFSVSTLYVEAGQYDYSISGSNGTLTFSHYGGSISMANGVVTATNMAGTSDRRLKTNIEQLKDVDVSDIKFYTYTFKNDTTHRKHYGVMAQDLQKYHPELVYQNPDGSLSVGFVDLLMLKVSQQDRQIQELHSSLTIAIYAFISFAVVASFIFFLIIYKWAYHEK